MAYRQVQQDTTAQLYGVSSALLASNDRVLTAALRQLERFGYDLERLQFIAQDEPALSGQVRQAYDRFAGVVTQVVDLIRAGKIAEAREMQLAEAGPLADRLERLTNQLVNRAEADMIASIATSQQSYATSQTVVIAFVCGQRGARTGARLCHFVVPDRAGDQDRGAVRQIAGGDFSQRVHVANRDELGALAADVNRTCEELGRLYDQLEAASRHKSEFLGQHEPRTAYAAERDPRLRRARAGRDLRRRTRKFVRCCNAFRATGATCSA